MSRTMLLVALASLSVAATGVATAARPTGDRAPQGHQNAEGLIATFKDPDARGHVYLKRVDADAALLSISLLKLQPGADYRLRGSTATCGEPSPPAAIVLSYGFNASQAGTIFRASTQVTHDVEFEHWASLRLAKSGNEVACEELTLLRDIAP